MAETDAEHFLNNLNNQFNPNKPIGSFVPHPQPVEAEQEVSDQHDADHFLSNLNNQFNPDKPGGIVVPNKPWKPVPEPVEVEQEVSDQDESFSWLDLHPQGETQIRLSISGKSNHCFYSINYSILINSSSKSVNKFVVLRLQSLNKLIFSASSCVSAAGQTCKFPFKYQGYPLELQLT